MILFSIIHIHFFITLSQSIIHVEQEERPCNHSCWVSQNPAKKKTESIGWWDWLVGPNLDTSRRSVAVTGEEDWQQHSQAEEVCWRSEHKGSGIYITWLPTGRGRRRNAAPYTSPCPDQTSMPATASHRETHKEIKSSSGTVEHSTCCQPEQRVKSFSFRVFEVGVSCF